MGASCEDVTPAAPELTQAVCADGVLSEPSSGAGVDRRRHLHGRLRTGRMRPVESVTVTATLAKPLVSLGVPRVAGGLDRGFSASDGDVGGSCLLMWECLRSSPGVPGVVEQATCTAGVVVPATVTLPTDS